MPAPLVCCRPNTTLTRSKDSVRIKGILDRLIKLHLNIIVPIIRLRDLVHDSQMRAVLAPSVRSTFVNKGFDELMSLSLLLGARAIENNTDNVIWLFISIFIYKDEADLRISRRPTVNVPMKSKPASCTLFLVTAN